jgi:hypothetical protein
MGAEAGMPLAAVARRLYADRRDRDDAFGKAVELFQEPAWDMLLELFIWHADGLGVPAHQLSATGHTAATSAMRWIAALEAAGLVHGWTDPARPDRQLVGLTPAGATLMTRYLEGRRLG